MFDDRKTILPIFMELIKMQARFSQSKRDACCFSCYKAESIHKLPFDNHPHLIQVSSSLLQI